MTTGSEAVCTVTIGILSLHVRDGLVEILERTLGVNTDGFENVDLQLLGGVNAELFADALGSDDLKLGRKFNEFPCSTSILSISLQSREDFIDSYSVYQL